MHFKAKTFCIFVQTEPKTFCIFVHFRLKTFCIFVQKSLQKAEKNVKHKLKSACKGEPLKQSLKKFLIRALKHFTKKIINDILQDDLRNL